MCAVHALIPRLSNIGKLHRLPVCLPRNTGISTTKEAKKPRVHCPIAKKIGATMGFTALTRWLEVYDETVGTFCVITIAHRISVAFDRLKPTNISQVAIDPRRRRRELCGYVALT